MSEKVKIEITKLLLAAEPDLLKGDAAAAARASHILCDVLGAMLASPVMIASGGDEETFKAVISTLVTRITDTAIRTAKAQITMWPVLSTTRQ